MLIKNININDLDKLKTLEQNKNLYKDFMLLIENVYNNEIMHVAINPNNEIIGVMSYEIIPLINSNLSKAYISIIEVKKEYTKQRIATSLIDFVFEKIKKETDIIEVSNIVLSGKHLINTYFNLAKKHNLDLSFSNEDEYIECKKKIKIN